MSDDSIVNVKFSILDMFTKLNQQQLNSIEQWICSQSYKKDLESMKTLQNSSDLLVKIGKAIKKFVPFDAEMSTEIIVPPTVGDQADCNSVNTCHIDEFLYDHNQVEALVKKGKINRHYCVDCNSRNVKDLTYISHSMSRQALQYMFKVLLPKDLEYKQILDVGSRFGSVIYAAYNLSNASSIVGVEMNKECCEIQQKIIGLFSMDNNRIKVVHSDIMSRSDLIENSNVLVINVLDFFVDTEKHRQMWYFFKKHTRKGTYLITNRSMVDTLSSIDMLEELVDWLNICKANQLENENLFDMEDCIDLFMYTVN